MNTTIQNRRYPKLAEIVKRQETALFSDKLVGFALIFTSALLAVHAVL